MPGALDHSPEDIIRYLLIQVGEGSRFDASPAEEWPVYVDSEPTEPANVITIYGTDGRSSGRVMIDGERQEHHGFQVRIRGNTAPAVYAKSRRICIALDSYTPGDTVVFSATTYQIANVSRTSDVTRLPTENPASKRRISVINGLISVRKV